MKTLEIEPISKLMMARKILLVCGILSSMLYVAMNVIAAILYEGYSSASQTVSELSAIGAPTRPLWLLLGIPYTLLATAFGWGVWILAGQNRLLLVVGGLMVAYESRWKSPKMSARIVPFYRRRSSHSSATPLIAPTEAPAAAMVITTFNAMLSADAPTGDVPAPIKTTGIPTAHATAFAHTHSDAPEA
jgi:hypothetical protein